MIETIALMTARSGSKSVPHKNILPCAARHVPMFLPNVKAAVDASQIDAVYTISDIPLVHSFAEYYDYNCIERPAELCGDDVPHYDVMRYGVEEILKNHPETHYIVLLLGNNCGCSSSDLNRAIEKLRAHPGCDSVMSVGVFNQFNPYRAFKHVGFGKLAPFLEDVNIPTNANDKNAAGDIYFFNGSFWVVTLRAFLANDGLQPYPWLGNCIMHQVQSEYIQEIDSWWQYDLVTQFENKDYDKDN